MSAAEGVAANDSDPGGPDKVLSVTTVLAEPEHGTLTYLNEDGSIASAPNDGSFGVDEFDKYLRHRRPHRCRRRRSSFE